MTGFLNNRVGDWNVEEFAKVLLAIVGILLMIPIFILLINLFSDETEDNAEKLIDSLVAKIDNLKDDEEGKFPIQGIKGWVLAGWSEDDSNHPDKCFFNSCLCVCKGDGDGCQDAGFCRAVDQKVVKFDTAEGVFDSGIIGERYDGLDTGKDVDASFYYRYFKDGVFVNELVILQGDNYFTYDIDRTISRGEKIKIKVKESGLIETRFPGVPGNVDAALLGWRSNRGIVYFFKGDNYYSYDIFKGGSAVEKSMSKWPGVKNAGESSVTAAFRNSVRILDRKTYFFRDGTYDRFNENFGNDGIVKAEGKDIPIIDGWKEIQEKTGGKIDAGYSIANKDFYFLSGNMYYIYRFVGLDSGNEASLDPALIEVTVEKRDDELYLTIPKAPIPPRRSYSGTTESISSLYGDSPPPP